MKELVYYKVETAKNFNSLIEANKLVKYAKQHGMSAIGVADAQSMVSVMDVYTLAMKQSIQPVISVQFRVFGVMSHDSLYVTLVAKNYEGYIEILSLHNAITTKDDGKTRRLKLKEIPALKHVIATVSITEAIKDERSILVSTILKGIKDRVGQENLWIEIEPAFSEDEKSVQLKVIEEAKKTGLTPIAAPTIRYFEQKQEKVLEVMQKARSKQKGMYNSGVATKYFLTSEEIEVAYQQIPESVEQTQKLREKCKVELPLKGTKGYQNKMCNFKVPTDFVEPFKVEEMFDKDDKFVLPTDEQERRQIAYLCYLAWQGFSEVYNNDPQMPQVRKRLKHELGAIIGDDETNYFLIVRSFIQFFQNNNIPVGPGRGSVVGSVLARCLDIIEIDPYNENLLFERFKNKNRKGVADIDIDVSKLKRYLGLQYAQDEYGFYHVGKIVSFNPHGAKDGLGAVAKVYEVPESLVSKMKESMKKDKAVIEEVIENEELVAEIRKKFPKIDEVLLIVQQIQHLPNSKGVHPAGIILSKIDLRNELPFDLALDKELNRNMPVIQYVETEKHLELLGHQKLDLLPLRNLDVRDGTIALVKEATGVDLSNIPLNDEKTFQMLAKGHTAGVFQVGSDEMQEIGRKLAPKTMEDIKNWIGIYRPGGKDEVDHFARNKRQNNQVIYDVNGEEIKGVEDIHPILRRTNGIIIYQEQIMRIAQEWSGYTLGEADILRRAISNKDLEILENERKTFVDKASEMGRDERTSNRLYDLIVKFEYGFNESHAVAYAKVVYQTAYLKANYPVQYMSVLITSVMDNTAKAAGYIKEAKRMGIEMYPPSVDTSGSAFVPYKDGIVFGLPMIKHLNMKAAKLIEEERNKRPFINFTEFLNRVHSSLVDRKVLKSLISVGMFEKFGNQNQLFEMLNKKEEPMQVPSEQFLFSDLANIGYDLKEELPQLEDIDLEEKILRQQQYASLVFEKSPLDGNRLVYGSMLQRLNKTQEVLGGVIVDKYVFKTKKHKKEMAYIQVQGMKKEVKVVVFDRIFEKVKEELGLYQYILFRARYDQPNNQYVLQQVEQVKDMRMLITFPRHVIQAGKERQMAWLQSFKEILERHPGEQKVVLTLNNAQKTYNATLSDELIKELNKIVSKGEFALEPVR
ncbi:hypothetical protein CN918_27800 [Priestia megaterium]|nr:hypothetical protein CN918_27800 [Priestia megaterium]